VAAPPTIAKRAKPAKTRANFLNFITVSFHLINIRFELQKSRVELTELTISELNVVAFILGIIRWEKSLTNYYVKFRRFQPDLPGIINYKNSYLFPG
jgi:hypothetical protein